MSCVFFGLIRRCRRSWRAALEWFDNQPSGSSVELYRCSSTPPPWQMVRVKHVKWVWSFYWDWSFRLILSSSSQDWSVVKDIQQLFFATDCRGLDPLPFDVRHWFPSKFQRSINDWHFCQWLNLLTEFFFEDKTSFPFHHFPFFSLFPSNFFANLFPSILFPSLPSILFNDSKV